MKDEHKAQREKIRQLGEKKDTMRIVFSDDKMFDLDGIYNSENDGIWAINREEKIGEMGKKQPGKFSEKVMVWSEGVASLALFEKGSLDHHRYIKEVLPVALQYGNSKFGNNWAFQQGNGTPHTHQETQE